jgi:hypothetical protein
MILCRLMGGLGNQMFQYAFAKSLALKYNVALKLDVSLIQTAVDANNKAIRSFDLDVFNIKDEMATQAEINRFNGSNNFNVVQKAIYKLKKISGKNPLYIQKENEFDEAFNQSIKSNACIVGRWQSEEYFKDYKNEIKEVFFPNKIVPNDYSKQLIDKSSKTIHVGIQVRRTDYITNKNYASRIGALDISYYKDAVDYVLQKIQLQEQPFNFYVVSDDMEWCKKHLQFIPNVIFVEQERSKKGYFSDLWILTQMHHNIISNSTFSWWGAWLGENQNSLVVAPSAWAKSKEAFPPRIVPSRWKSLNNRFATTT